MIDSRSMLSRRRFMATSAAVCAVATLPRLTLAGTGYREIGVLEGGSIKGQVSLKGEPPKPDRILISKDNAHCGEGHVTPDPARLSSSGQVAHAIVAIKNVPAGKSWPKEMAGVSIVQEKCVFHPYIQVARKGVELRIVNKDPLLHNIHAYELIGRARRNMFNIAQPAAGQVDTHVLKTRRGHRIEIDCDAHNWMSAWIYLSDHPYATITDDQGQFALNDVPLGTFELVAWHPALGTGEHPITVTPKTPSTLDIDITLQV